MDRTDTLHIFTQFVDVKSNRQESLVHINPKILRQRLIRIEEKPDLVRGLAKFIQQKMHVFIVYSIESLIQTHTQP